MTIYYDALQNGALKALSFLIAGIFIYGAYWFGAKYQGDEKSIFKKNFWGYTSKILIAILVIGFISWIFSSNLGTHTENCDDSDPLYGGSCDRVQDFEPTSKKYQEEFAKLFVLLFIPYVYGLFKRE